MVDKDWLDELYPGKQFTVGKTVIWNAVVSCKKQHVEDKKDKQTKSSKQTKQTKPKVPSKKEKVIISILRRQLHVWDGQLVYRGVTWLLCSQGYIYIYIYIYIYNICVYT